MKVRVIKTSFDGLFEDEINEFIANKKVIDIKLSSDNGYNIALIMYEL